MNKNWLIRTKNNHILGPVSKSKVVDLIQNGSIKGADEVSSGNGFWMYVREEELIKKYVFSDEPQPFNPVQEAENVLTPNDHKNLIVEEINLSTILPDDTDLEFPSLTAEPEDDFTKIGLSIDQLKEQVKVESLDEVEFGEDEVEEDEVEEEESDNIVDLTGHCKTIETEEIKISAKKVKKNKKEMKPVKQSIFSFRILYIIAISLFLLAITALYFRKDIIKGVVETASVIVPSAHAQSLFIPQKKNGLS